MTLERDARGPRPLDVVAAVVGLVLLAVELPFIVTSGLIFPVWAVVILLVAWGGLVWLGMRWFRRHPYRVLVLPLGAAALWFGMALLGGALGWTA